MAKYAIPWAGMMPVVGMTILVALMGPGLKMYDEYFITGGKPKRFAMDYFDKIMEQRDEKIAGSMYNQQSHPFNK